MPKNTTLPFELNTEDTRYVMKNEPCFSSLFRDFFFTIYSGQHTNPKNIYSGYITQLKNITSLKTTSNLFLEAFIYVADDKHDVDLSSGSSKFLLGH